MHHLVMSLLAVVVSVLSTIPAYAGGGTALTYQGRLLDAGQPANGPFNIDFSLWDDPAAGSQIGSTVSFIGLSIADGLITVELDFGADAFDNTGRWLNIIVDGVPLAPRQPITRTPYSIQTRGIYVDENQRIGIGTTNPLVPLHVTTDAVGVDAFLAFSENASGVIGRTNSANGSGIFGRHDPTNNLGLLGTSEYGVYGRAIDMNNDWAGYFNGRTHVTDTLFIGREDPVTSAEYFGLNAPVGDNAFGGMYISTNTNGGKPFYGYAPGGIVQAYHYYDGNTSKWHLYNQGIALTVDISGNVGIGTTNPEHHLHVLGSNTFGIFSETISSGGTGVLGFASHSDGSNKGVSGFTNSQNGYGVFSGGDYGGTGAKYFVQPHPYDPSKEIRFVCLEGNESGTYFRGSSRLENGRAYIDVPEEFRLVSELDGLTVQVTAMGPNAGLWVESKDLDRIVVVGNGNVEFDYFVNGVRRGFADLELIRENYAYVPEVRGVPYGTQYREGHRQILVENGILNPDFTPNQATAAMMGWTLRDPEPDELSRAGLSAQGENK